MKLAFLFSAVFLISVPAWATPADQETFCRMLVEHKPAPDVEYRVGTDIHGNPVVGPNVSGTADLRNFETIEIPVEIDLIERFGLDAPAGMELKPYAALISIHKDGKVDYNGQDISSEAQVLCDQSINKDNTNE